MQYYDSALEHLSTIDLESFRSILPEPMHPFVLLSYPIRSERSAEGNSSTGSRYLSQQETGQQHVHAGGQQRVFGDTHAGYDAGPSSSTGGTYRSGSTGGGVDGGTNCQARPPYHSYHHAASHASVASTSTSTLTSTSSTSHLPLCEPLTIPHPSTHPHNLFYDKGPNDALFVIFWAVFFTILREALMRWAYRPFIRWHLSRLDAQEREKDGRSRERETKQGATAVASPAVGERGEERLSKKEQKLRDRVIVRFAEQAWTCTYATVFWSLGFVSLITACGGDVTAC